MSMKGRLELFTAMAALFGGMGGMPMQTREPQHPIYKGNGKLPRLRSFNHTGEIPKGCKKDTVRLNFDSDNVTLSIFIEVVFASEKSRLKKINQAMMEIAEYLSRLDLAEVKSRGEFEITEKDLEKQPNPEQ